MSWLETPDEEGTAPDVVFQQLDPGMRDILTVGQAIAREPG